MKEEESFDEKVLLALVAAGDREAFTRLYERYWKRIYTLALMYSKSQETSEDLVQEVFIKLWTFRDRLTLIEELRPYLFVMARNLIISQFRKKLLHGSLNITEVDFLKDEFLQPDNQLAYKETLGLLNEAVTLLPPQQKKAYHLSRQQGLSYEAIAREMQISKLTVRTHLTKAFAFIRHYLSSHNSVSVFFVFLLLMERK
jgi:RNA polymerase sigma-70 factor (ECF subfamily)